MLQMLLLRLPVLAASYFLSVNKESESWILCQVNCIKRWEAALVVCVVQQFICDNSLDFTKGNRKSSKSAAKIFLQLGSEIIK